MSQGKLKILVVDPSFFTPLYDHYFCEALAKEGHEVVLATRVARTGEPELRNDSYQVKQCFYSLSEKMLRKGMHKRWVLPLKGIEHLLGLSRLLFFSYKNGFDAIHFQWLTLPVFDYIFLQLCRKIPVFFTFHDSTIFQGSPSSIAQYFGYRSCLHRFKHIFVHTQEGKESLRRMNIPDSRSSIVLPGPLPFFPDSSSRPPISVKNIILFFGNIRPYKGLPTLLKAYSLLPVSLRADWTIQVSGNPLMDMTPTFALSKELGIDNQICWDLRYVPEEEVSSILASAKILVFPYRFIDLSAILWAILGHKTCVIASSAGLFNNVIRDGENGLLFPPDSSLSLAEKLKHLLESPELIDQLSDNFAKSTKQKFNWPESAQKTLYAYMSVIRFAKGNEKKNR